MPRAYGVGALNMASTVGTQSRRSTTCSETPGLKSGPYQIEALRLAIVVAGAVVDFAPGLILP
jgi:hypothetical protein